MLEMAIMGSFFAVLLICIVLGKSILSAMLAGYAIFCLYGLIKGHPVRRILRMSWAGISTVRNILITFILIGFLTAVWRDCGTIAYIIYHSSGLIAPSVFLLVAFLLCCFVSMLTGTAFGTAAIVGVICMTLANAMEINPILAGGAILSGGYFGDRCSPMSTSALLVSQLTGTDIYRNVKNMVRTSVVPFIITFVLYLVLGLNQGHLNTGAEIWSLFPNNFNLKWIVVLPALLIIGLCACRVKVKVAMAVSVLSGCAISLLVQDTTWPQLLRLLLSGFRSPDQDLAVMMDGGGLASMVTVMAIVCLSSCYAGIFDGTGLLNGLKPRIARLSERFTDYGGLLISSVLTSMLACNQTLSIMLTHYLCRDTMKDKERLAVNLENTVVMIAPLIPWSIACAVPLAAAGAPIQSIPAAFYLYLIPLWNLLGQRSGRTGKMATVFGTSMK